MANHVSAVKRVNQTRKRTAVNRQRKGILRANLRGFRETLDQGNGETIQKQHPQTVSSIDKAARKGLIHKNTAARLKSRLMARINSKAAAKNS
jgi:small subunit ribosomal protein S20